MGRRPRALEDVVGLSRTLLLLGAKGRLGGAIAAAASRRGRPCLTLAWDAVGASADPDTLRSRLREAGAHADVVFAGGLTDPALSAEALHTANVDLPALVVEAGAGRTGLRFLAIGSTLACLPALVAGNRYLASKAALAARVTAWASEARLRACVRLLGLHTLYGAAPAPHSFLGQIHTSLATGAPFRMSAGRQLREFHHVDDVAESVLALTVRDWDAPAALNLSTGRPVHLAELAQAIFHAFGREGDLVVGALATPAGENEGTVFARSPDWLLGRPREPVAGIVEWLGARLKARA